MSTGELLAVLLFLIPVIGAAVVLIVRRRGAIVWTVVFVSAILVLASIGLLAYMASTSFEVLAIGSEDLYPMGPAMIIIGVALAGLFIVIGWRIRSPFIVTVATINLVLDLGLESWTDFREAAPAVLIDNLALILILITSVVGSIIAIYALRYMRDDTHQPRFFAVTLLFLGSMNGAVLCNDMLWLVLFWDVTTLCSFLLIGHTGTEEAQKAARRALGITLAGATALIVGAMLAFYYYGTQSVQEVPLAGLDGLALMPLALMAVAAFTKSAQLPFQSWLLGAMVAPTPVSALLHSATMVNLGVYLLLRLSPSIVEATAINWLVALVGGASFLASSILAMTQSNAKRVLAWSTVGNLGLITMCVGVSTPLAITAGVILLFYHSISKALMFLSVGAAKESLGSEDIEDMQGMWVTMPFVSAAIFIGVVTIVLPPFGMFASKWIISSAATAFPLLIFLLGVGFASIVVYYFKWIGNILSAVPARQTGLRRDPLAPNYKWTLGALMVGAVGLSALIGPVVRFLVEPFIERYFTLPVGTNDLNLFTASGEFPVFIFLLLTGIIFVGLSLLIHPGAEEISKPYASGEDFVFESRGSYFFGEASVRQGIALSEGTGILLVALLLAIPLLLEVA
ncbi:MAG: proton-conducting transporter membrane subunit [Methanomassiliicoccus sp.]|nr:proton-conducting transporter membrane subunit [Methanomassiliicoccus sp.]